jgi:phage replication O-like protein O
MARLPKDTRVVEHIAYSFVPNHRATMEALAQARLSGREYSMMLVILNQTDGYLREEDQLSPSFLADRTCIPKPHIANVRQLLLDKGIITFRKEGRKEFYAPLRPPWRGAAANSPKTVKPPIGQGEPPVSVLTGNGENEAAEAPRGAHQKRRNGSPKTVKRLTKNGETQSSPTIRKPLKENPLKKTGSLQSQNAQRVEHLKNDPEFLGQLAAKFPGLDMELELVACDDHWGTRVRAPKKAFINWLKKAAEFAKEGHHGRSQGRATRAEPRRDPEDFRGDW